MINVQDIVRIAQQAGEKILEIYSSDFTVETKNDNGQESPLTTADKAAHQIISDALQAYGIPVLSEEGKSVDFGERKDWSELWIVDPLDGTKEFIKKTGEFTVNIALVRCGVPVLGVVHVPVNSETYWSDGTKSFKQDADGVREIYARSIPDIPVVVASVSHMNKETEDYISKLRDKYGDVALVSKGSSLKLCLVAEGKADMYPRLGPTCEWDTAAAHAVVRTAGKHVFVFDTDQELTYNKEDVLNPFFIVR